jgi:hypothetical protein
MQINEMRWVGDVERMGELRRRTKFLSEKNRGENPQFGRHRLTSYGKGKGKAIVSCNRPWRPIGL